MVSRLLFSATFAALTFASAAESTGQAIAAQQPVQSFSPPFFDPQAFAFARLDLTKIDPDAVEQSLRSELAELKLRDFAAGLADRHIRHLAARLRRLKELKVEHVYVILTLYGLRAQLDLLWRDSAEFLYAVVPVTAAADPAEVMRVFAQDPPGTGTLRTSQNARGNVVVSRQSYPPESTWPALHFHSAAHVNDATHGNIVIAGPPQIVDYVIKSQGADRTSAQTALAYAGDGPAQLVVAPSGIFAQIALEVLGPVPAGPGMSLGHSLAGFQWAAFGLESENGKLRARLTIQSRDNAAAQGLKGLIDRGLTALADNDDTAQLLGPLARLVELKVEDSQIIWQIDAEHTPADKLRTALRPAVREMEIRLGTKQSIDNLRAIGLAFHNTHDVYKAYPTPANYDQDGKPLLSWRVHVLPYVEEGNLYRQFRRNETWDSEHNKKLIEQMPSVYRRPFADSKSVKTPYLMPLGEKTVFQRGKKTTMAEIRDGTSKTISIVEVDPEHEVIWTKPDDWEVDWQNPTKGLAGGPRKTFAAVLHDNSVRLLPATIPADQLRALLTGNGGELVDRQWFPELNR
jgi:hypothetical protein